MELALSLGDTTPKPLAFSFLDRPTPKDVPAAFFLTRGKPSSEEKRGGGDDDDDERRPSSDPRPIIHQLDLLPFTPVLRSHHPSSQLPIPNWLTQPCRVPARELDVNRFPVATAEETDDGTSLSSPNSAVSPFQMDFSCMRNSNSNNAEYGGGGGGGGGRNKKRSENEEGERASDEDENGSTRKKLRLSKEQSAFLEESFKEHTTLNPVSPTSHKKQKHALAKQLNLRPRQVEVWFQNRRARTKLKQTEVDCEYLKRCCETLTEENRRLQKELQELRALKTSQPFYMQLPATTLTMCPSCERVATNSNSNSSTNNNNSAYQIPPPVPVELSLSKPTMFPFTNAQAQAHN